MTISTRPNHLLVNSPAYRDYLIEGEIDENKVSLVSDGGTGFIRVKLYILMPGFRNQHLCHQQKRRRQAAPEGVDRRYTGTFLCRVHQAESSQVWELQWTGRAGIAFSCDAAERV